LCKPIVKIFAPPGYPYLGLFVFKTPQPIPSPAPGNLFNYIERGLPKVADNLYVTVKLNAFNTGIKQINSRLDSNNWEQISCFFYILRCLIKLIWVDR